MTDVNIVVGRMPTLDQILEFYRESGLGARRPIDDEARIAQMFGTCNLIVSA